MTTPGRNLYRLLMLSACLVALSAASAFEVRAQTAGATPAEPIPDLRLPGFSSETAPPAAAPALPAALPPADAPSPLPAPSSAPTAEDTGIKVKIPSVEDSAAPINNIATPLAEDTDVTPDPLQPAATAPEQNNATDLSLMFDAAQIARVNQVLKAYDSGLSVDIQDENGPTEKSQDEILNDILTDLKATEANAAPKYYPNFILSSLVYYRPDDWTVWLTGVKITPKNNKPENPVYIKSIGPGSVVIAWKPNENIRPALHYVWNKKKTTKRAKEEAKSISTTGNASAVNIVLRTNQTFIAGRMVVREGIITQTVTPQIDQAAVNEQQKTTKPEPSAIDAMQELFPDADIQNPAPAPNPAVAPGSSNVEPGIFPGARGAITDELKARLSPSIPKLLENP